MWRRTFFSTQSLMKLKHALECPTAKSFIRSERQLMEQLNYNLLFRWFVGLSPDDSVWDVTVFTKNRERLQKGDVFQKVHGGVAGT